MGRHGQHDGQGGQATVEMALVLPVLLLIVIGIVEFGRIYSDHLILQNAAREGVRVAAVGGTDGDVWNRVVASAPGLDPNKLTMTVTRDTTAKLVTVALQYPVTWLTGFMANVVGGGTFTLRASAVMAYAVGP